MEKVPFTINGLENLKNEFNNLKKEEKPYEEIINSEFSIIQENKNNDINPRSHGWFLPF